MAALSLGLRDDSRIKMKISGARVTLDQQLLAVIADALKFIQWTKTDHGKRRRYDGKSIYETLMNPKGKDEYQVFNSPEEFDAYMKTFEV